MGCYVGGRMIETEIKARLITIDGLCKYMSIGRNKAYKLCQLPDFPTVKLGTKILIDVDDLDKWIDKQRKVK